ncbi:Peptidyl-Lys metalloendopeptidase [Hypsizygus marmoreus]|uniref:Peptidyl-Lys metalloendopeptidase n=1 Tax=Hypsizygus marmoreus TaxID=39966 RepID=A0A369KAM4_HYPMA|nr:Peptidyl-Lys metalloendopeptidase [Hypsizygus marmoreus]
MFSSALRATLIALVASAVAVSAASGLSLKVTGPETVHDVDNLKVVTTVTNTGDETLKILNDPRGPLNKLAANTFAITDANGAVPAFTGVKVKYVPSAAIAAGKDAVTVLAPGQSVSVEHNLSEAYNFTHTGEGAYNFEASNLFFIVDSANKAVPIYADNEAHSAKLSGKLAIARRSVDKRATYNGCSSSQQSLLASAASAAQSYASNALSYANAHTSASTRYTTWFGTYTASRHTTVVSHFSKISGNTFSSYKYDCTCTDSGTYAYVYPDTFATVYLCGAFWNAPTTGTDSKGGTLIHESSHFTSNGGTDDYVYGQAGAKSLAISNPNNAVFNADNHEYFAENNPSLA